jgi:hypothetical protein
MDMTLRKVLAASALAALLAFPASAVFAQSSGAMGDSGSSSASSSSGSMGESGSMSSAPGQSAQIDDATLQKAAKAYVKVKQIVHQSKQADSSGNGAQADPAAAQSAKLNAVRNEGLDPQQYNQVIQMVQNDPQLQQKFANYVTQNGGDTD